MANEFDPTEPVGHKWTLTALWKYLASEVRKLKLQGVTTLFSELFQSESLDLLSVWHRIEEAR